MLGVGIRPTSGELARKLEVSPEKTVEVVRVLEGSPAYLMGLRAGAVISKIDGKTASRDQFLEIMLSKKPGEEVSITYLSPSEDGTRVTVTAQGHLVEWKGEAAAPGRETRPAVPLKPLKPKPETKPAGAPVKLGVTVRQEDDFRLLVTEVVPGGNAAEAGVRVGDIITAVGENKVRTIDGLKDVLKKLAAGEENTIEYKRGESTITATMVFAREGKSPRLVRVTETAGGPPAVAEEPEEPQERKPAFLGVSPEEGEKGLVIAEVVEASSAAQMGLREGDVILSVNGKDMRRIDDLRRILRALHAGDKIAITLLRDGKEMVIGGTLGARPESRRTAPGPAPSAGSSAAAKASGGDESGGAAPARAIASAAGGEPRAGALGILAVTEAGRVWVDEILPASAAGDAGVRAGDRILRVGARSVDGFDALSEALEGSRSGDRLVLSVEREGAVLQMPVTLRPLPSFALRRAEPAAATIATAALMVEPAAGGAPFLGIEVEELSEVGKLVVVSVDQGGPAERAGVKAGDELLTLQGKVLRRLDGMRSEFTSLRAGDRIELGVRRGDRQVSIAVTLGSR
ncbi:MAG: PDZ domain-containing protein [Planctomycetota bacterium]